MDNKKALIVKRGKVIEKMPSFGRVGSYMVEFEDGGRARLRSYKEKTLPIAPGDVGIFRYRGMTIEGFQREGMGMRDRSSSLQIGNRLQSGKEL